MVYPPINRKGVSTTRKRETASVRFFKKKCCITNALDRIEDNTVWENGGAATNSEVIGDIKNDESFLKPDTDG
ncbi:hypothetical protein TNCV_3324851 [Trichonephila clavipes]|nr:hypothetical protein TNCV_3324851 [Trichonephila clavipes]